MGLRIGLADLIVRQLHMLIQHTHQALKHFASSTGDLAQHHLGRQLSAKVALFIGNRIWVEVIEKLRQDVQFFGERNLKLSGNCFGACLHATEELLRHTDPLSQICK